MGGYRRIEHTADTGLRIWGDSLPDLFQAATRGLLSLLVDPKNVRPTWEEPVEVEAPAVDLLLQAYLKELLYRFWTRRLIPARVEAEEASETRFRGRLHAMTAPPDLALRSDLKAVTYHQLQVRHEGGRLVARVIFDV